MNCIALNRAGRFGLVLSMGLVFSLNGCADPSAPQGAASARRSNVAPPFITLSPQSVELARGASVVLTARPQGGEAMLFSVDWKIAEGAAGGSISGAGSRKPDGSFEMTYTAPATGAGPFHVVAAIREYPSASAVATIAMSPAR